MAYPQKIAALHDTNHRGKTMGLRLKFNLALLFVFALGFAVSGYLSYNLLHKNAREEVLRNAGVMMEAALSMRQYTVSQVRDKLMQKEDEFLPQTVPAFAATEMMNQQIGRASCRERV